MLPDSPKVFMGMVGVIEMIAGVIVLIKPRIGSLIISIWLIGIAFNLLFTTQYLDVAVWDAVMAIDAFSLYLLSSRREH